MSEQKNKSLSLHRNLDIDDERLEVLAHEVAVFIDGAKPFINTADMLKHISGIEATEMEKLCITFLTGTSLLDFARPVGREQN